ncbi:hypothetical protein GOP47_0002888 [Adiantum capillus-veneris]|uniref:Cytochrome P450 n=1 Tax=Adiantum capillus-veneris TaxID=13818 RepID=A0A9D4VAY2_ADICA|nr:hypothetical protein GOP47_0002888 [Adiantum capillus-veneris]
MAILAIAALLLLLLLSFLHKTLSLFVWEPLRIQRCLRAQGVSGPSYRLLVGNFPEISAMMKAIRASPLPHVTHNIMPRVLPDYSIWSEKYGKQYLYWLGWKARLAVVDPELCKEVLFNKFGHYAKPNVPVQLQDVLVNGLITLEGEKWTQHRRVVSPAFFLNKLKGMVPTIVDLTSAMLEKWKSESACKEIDAFKEFHALAANIIAHTAFGSSYAEGKQVSLLQYQQQVLMSKLTFSVIIPGIRFVPTAMNRYRWSLMKQVTTILKGIVKQRLSRPSDAYGSDLLGLMLSALKEEGQRNLTMSLQEILDECRTFFFAGHETTSALLTWTVMLLAKYPEWQERAREEVLSLFGGSHPDADSLNHLKTVGMILQESLRLYPPVTGTYRDVTTDVKLGGISVPKGCGIFIPILPLHVDSELWGADALDFNPLRFANGVLNACKQPSAFLPFGTGPRTCVGQNFAMLEAKTVLCMVLQKFRFRLSPGYRHAPTLVLTLQAENGMQILLEPLVA